MALTLQSNWLPETNPAVLVEAVNQANPAVSDGFLVCSIAVEWHASDPQCDLAAWVVSGDISNCRVLVDLTPTGVEWTGLTGTYAHMPFDGSIGWQTSCPTSRSPCARIFTCILPI